MALALEEVGRVVIAVLVAWLESVSVLVFVWNGFYAVYPILCIWSLFSVFVLNTYGAYRNTRSFDDILKKDEDPGFYLNFFLSFLLAMVGFLGKRFALMIYFPSNVFFESLSFFLVMTYTIYVLLNTYSDMKQVSQYLVYPREDIDLVDIYPDSLTDMVLYTVLTVVFLVRCHYKALEVSISVASLVEQYGGAYSFLLYTKRIISFPVVASGLYNVKRCVRKLKQAFSDLKERMGIGDIACICVMLPAAYVKAISSKTIALSSGNSDVVTLICGVHDLANQVRRVADILPCHEVSK